MRRLDSIGRMARVLDFPDRSSRSEPQGGSGVASRWVAAAAVIGLVAGLGTGVLVDRRFIQRQVSEVRIAPAAGLADDDLLGDIDQALLDSAAPELSAIDAFTPAMHEVVFTSR
jgi:hypothetical protein